MGFSFARRTAACCSPSPVSAQAEAEQSEGVIQSLKSGFGFISSNFGRRKRILPLTALTNADFNDLRVGGSSGSDSAETRRGHARSK